MQIEALYTVHRAVEDSDFAYHIDNKQLLYHSSNVRGSTSSEIEVCACVFGVICKLYPYRWPILWGFCPGECSVQHALPKCLFHLSGSTNLQSNLLSISVVCLKPWPLILSLHPHPSPSPSPAHLTPHLHTSPLTLTVSLSPASEDS